MSLYTVNAGTRPVYLLLGSNDFKYKVLILNI